MELTLSDTIKCFSKLTRGMLVRDEAALALFTMFALTRLVRKTCWDELGLLSVLGSHPKTPDTVVASLDSSSVSMSKQATLASDQRYT